MQVKWIFGCLQVQVRVRIPGIHVWVRRRVVTACTPSQQLERATSSSKSKKSLSQVLAAIEHH